MKDTQKREQHPGKNGRKVVLITGASGRIATHVAKRFLSGEGVGFDVIFSYRSEEKGKKWW